MSAAKFVVASPGHASIYDNEALALHRHGLLKFIALGTRRGVDGLPLDVTRLLPSFGLWTYATARTFSRFSAESFRFRAHPYFDNRVRKQLAPGDHVISSYGYANNSFKWARALDNLKANPALREQYGKRGAASIISKGMTADHMIAKHIELYESILAT